MPKTSRYFLCLRSRGFLFALTIILWAGNAFPACEIDDISQQLTGNSAYYTFSQTKTIPALSSQLRSSGVIWLAPESQLLWQVRSPVRSTTVISAEGVREYNRQDQLLPAINFSMAEDLAEILLNVIGGNFSALGSSFTPTLECDDTRWKLNLEPVSPRFSRILESLSIAGDDSIHHIAYREARGDTTEIDLTSESQPDTEQFRIYLDD